MKKIFIFISVFLLLICKIFPQVSENSTAITSIQVEGKSLLPSAWDNLLINTNDTITFFYNTTYNKAKSKDIFFKLFLDGKILETGIANSDNHFVTLKNLQEGEHIFKVSAYTIKGWESSPALIQFRVRSVYATSNVPESSNTVVKGELSTTSQTKTIIESDMITYILLGVIVILSLIIVYLIFSKKNSGGRVTEKDLKVIKEETEDYKYSYEKLKKEAANLAETNGFLKIQIQELKAYVKDLEDANVQLVGQKEKLMESKRQLIELQKQKDELFAIAVHDIKNPASIIKGLIELLTDYDLNANDQQHIIQSLSETSTRIIDLAQKMAQVCARTKTEPEVVLESASIKEIIDSVCKRNMAYANNKGIKLINNTSINTPNVDIDKGKIDEVVDNLVNNAIKYGPEGTVVQVKSFFNQTKVTVEINDTGVGFSEEDLGKVFQKGVILSSSPTGGETRSGLGLWIVKKIIDDHGGTITLESKKGKGSRFLFELPIKKK